MLLMFFLGTTPTKQRLCGPRTNSLRIRFLYIRWTAQISLTCAPKIYYISDANVNPMTTTSKLAGQQLVNQIYSCQVYNYDFFLMNIFDRFLT
jgi:hypothetical protein